MSNHKKNGRPLSHITQALHEQIPNDKERDIYREVAIWGRSAIEIAKRHGKTEAQVNGILFRMRKWIEQMKMPINLRGLQALHLQRLEHQWHEAMGAWYRSGSGEETMKVSLEEQRSNSTTDKEGKRKVEKTTRAPCGDARYLEQARKIMAEFRSLSAEALVVEKAIENKEQTDDKTPAIGKNDKAAAKVVVTIRERNGAKGS